MTEELIEHKFSTSLPASLYLCNIRGKVEIVSGMEGEILVTAKKLLHTGDEKNTQIIIEQESDGRVYVETRMPAFSSWLSGSKPCKVEYQIRLPRSSKVEVSNVSSSCSIEGIEGNIQVKSVSGDIILADLSGSMRLKSVSGDIEGKRLSGPLDFNTVSGDVNLSNSYFSAISGRTVSGDMLLETPLPEGEYKASTVSGDLHLSLPEEQGLTISISSMSGGIRTNSGRISNLGSQRYEIGGGGPHFRYNSVSGSFLVKSRDGSPPSEAETQPAPERRAAEEPSDRTLDVLQQIEEGKISVEEGLRLLTALEQ